MFFKRAFRPSKKSQKHRKKSSVRATKPSQLRSRLRIISMPNRTLQRPSLPVAVRGKFIRRSLIPTSLIKQMAQHGPFKTLKQIKESISIKKLAGVDSIPVTPADHIHCIKRQVRRSILFSNRIAGHNKHKSPGRGGTYKRTAESKLGC